MAYAFSTSIDQLGNQLVVTIAESDCGSTDEATITLDFSRGRVIKQACSKTSGTAATVNPLLGTAPNPAGNTVVVANDSAADPVANVIQGGMPFLTNGTLVHRSQPNAGADNVIESIYYIIKDWS
jgi:hypothetical protein